jgi:hypothetical protein
MVTRMINPQTRFVASEALPFSHDPINIWHKLEK